MVSGIRKSKDREKGREMERIKRVDREKKINSNILGG